MSTSSHKLRALIVDDEPVARETLRTLLDADEEVELIGECRNGREALAQIRETKPDILFLDVEMPDKNGLEVLTALDDQERPAVIFTTAYQEYAVQAFEEHAVDYLLKPFDDARFERALGRAKQRHRSQHLARMGEQVADLVESLRVQPEGTATSPGTTPTAPTRLSVHKEGHIELIDLDELEWIEAADQYVRLHCRDNTHLMRSSLGTLEESLDSQRFLRVHRSAIVALDQVVRLETRSGGTGRILLRNGAWVPVSRSRVPTVRRMLG